MSGQDPQKWHEIPGVLALVIVLGPLALLCIAATFFGWWGR